MMDHGGEPITMIILRAQLFMFLAHSASRRAGPIEVMSLAPWHSTTVGEVADADVWHALTPGSFPGPRPQDQQGHVVQDQGLPVWNLGRRSPGSGRD
jgi:hypothetical protein